MKNFLLILISLVFFVSCEKKEEAFSREMMLKNIYHQQIIPNFTKFSDECSKLSELINSYSADPSQENLQSCRDQFIAVVLSWRHCDIYNVGDYQRTFIKSHIYSIFGEWTFNSQKEKLASIKSLETLGTTLKGINGLEFLLFDKKLERKKFVSYMSLVAKELKGLADESLKIWRESEESFIKKNDLSFGSSIQELVNEQVRYIEEFYFKKFSYPLGYLYSVDFSIVEHYDSKISILALKESVKSVEELFSNHFYELIRFQNKDSKLPQQMKKDFTAVNAILAKFEKLPVYEDEAPIELQNLFLELRKILISVRVGVVNQLGVTVVIPNDGD